MRAPAQVIQGMRTTETQPRVEQFPAEHQGDATPNLMETRPAAEGERVYHSHISGLIVQVTAPQDRFDPSTGAFHRTPPKKAFFKPLGPGGVSEFRTSDREIIKELDSNPRFALDGEYWDAMQFAARAKAVMRKSLKEQLARDPELMGEVLQEMTSSDFELPSSPTT